MDDTLNPKHKLLIDYNPNSFYMNESKTYSTMNDTTIMLASFAAVFLILSNFLSLDYIFSFQLDLGINIVNYYRGVTYILLGTLHIYRGKVDLENEKNFQKDYFRSILFKTFFDNLFIVLLLLSLKYLQFVSFSFYLCLLIIVKIIFAKIYFQEEMKKLDFALIGLSLVLALIHFYNKIYDNKPDYLKGVIFFTLSTIAFTVKKVMKEKINNKYTPNYYLYLIGSGMFGLITSPIILFFEHADNHLGLFSTILIILISVSAFYSKCLFNKIYKNLEQQKDYKNFVYSNLFLIMFIFISFFKDVLSISDFFVAFSIICLYVIKFLHP